MLRPILSGDNVEIAGIIRSVLLEFGAAKPGTVYYDPTTDDLFGLFENEGSVYFILESEGKIMGGSGVYPTAGLPQGCCELVKLYLLPEGRNRGWGRVLIEHCLEKARQLGYRQVYLETMPELSNAIELYRKCGFKNLGGPLGSSGHFSCDLWMLRDL